MSKRSLKNSIKNWKANIVTFENRSLDNIKI